MLMLFLEAVANRNMDVAEALFQAGCDINIAKYENREAPIHSAIKLCKFWRFDPLF